MRQAIETKWIGPTRHRPSRIKATADAGSVTLEWDYSLSQDGNHMEAARTLAEKLGWSGEWAGGSLPNSSGYAFVCGSDGFGSGEAK